MAHHDDNFTVDGQLVVQVVVAVLKFVDLAIECGKSVLVLDNLLSVVLDVRVVLVFGLGHLQHPFFILVQVKQVSTQLRIIFFQINSFILDFLIYFVLGLIW